MKDSTIAAMGARGVPRDDADPAGLAQRIRGLLDDPAYQGHPLHAALADFWADTQEKLARIEQIVRAPQSRQEPPGPGGAPPDERFERQARRLSRLAGISRRYQDMARQVGGIARDMAERDALTGLYNRRMVMERLGEEARLPASAAQAHAVALIDIDHFKGINDCYGRELGDRVLVAFTRVLTECLRAGELCARWGGEEFLVVLPGAPLAAARRVAVRVQEQLRRQPLVADGQALWVTISVGIALVRAGGHLPQALERAGRALGRAKQLGRDRICGEDELDAASA